MEIKPQVHDFSSCIRTSRARVSVLALAVVGLVCALTAFTMAAGVQASSLEQHPTVSIPTVTGTPRGAYITVPIDQQLIYVRSGPGRSYPIVGILVTGETTGALAFSAEGEWVEIIYLGIPGDTGWVFTRLVTLTDADDLPEVPPPPTPTPNKTPTLPAGAERFAEEPTRLPTYTPAAPVVQPTFVEVTQETGTGPLPIGFIIIGLAVLGAFGILLSILRGR